MTSVSSNPSSPRGGFTIVELLMAISILVIVTTGSWALFLAVQRNGVAASLAMRTTSEAARAMQQMVYAQQSGLPTMRAATAQTVAVTTPAAGGWEIALDGTGGVNRTIYEPANGRIVHANGFVYSDNVLTSSAIKANGGCMITVTVQHVEGPKTNTSSISTFVRFRNKQ